MQEQKSEAIDTEALFFRACDQHQKGKLNESQSILETIVKKTPKHFDAWHSYLSFQPWTRVSKPNAVGGCHCKL